jgi:hypothetical protein
MSVAFVQLGDETNDDIVEVHSKLEKAKALADEAQELSDSRNDQRELWCIQHEWKNLTPRVNESGKLGCSRAKR